MKFTLKDYQRDAVRDALDNLKDAQDDWRRKSRKSAFSLTAVTGAGKTVMAAAAFEALFHGDDEFDFDADPGAVVIWFSDDPSLNEQTRFRLMDVRQRPGNLERGREHGRRTAGDCQAVHREPKMQLTYKFRLHDTANSELTRQARAVTTSG